MSRTARHRRARRRSWLVSLASGVGVGVVVGAVLTVSGIAIPVTSAQAVDSSAVTVTAAVQDTTGSAPMPDLKVSVSQTRDLLAQGIQIDWTGGIKSQVPDGQTGGANFLQIMQCWGDDPENKDQPDRTTCQYGAFNTPGARRDASIADPKNVNAKDQPYTAAATGPFDQTYTSIPFKSKTGATVASVVDGKKIETVDVNTNQFFTRLTSNEISWAGSGSNGAGSVKFEVQTAAQSPGLGCGTPIETAGTVTGATSCWLVVIPRGTADAGEDHVINSGLFYDAWQHKLAVRLDFLPVGVRCTIGAAERQLSGSELSSEAISSWQPSLCGAADGAAYTTITGAETDAALAANGTGVQPMALTSRALSVPDVKDNLTYAPIALTGVSIAFSIDREPSAIGEVPADVSDRARLAFDSMNLTPRLVAKLLTSSYIDSLPTRAPKTHLGTNARNITYDRDFLQINDPEWAYQSINSPSIADLLAPQGRSDSAWAVWNYVLSDQDARDFLAGKPDPWGMVVNPYSSSDPAVYESAYTQAGQTPTGAPLTYPREDFPKGDPSEQPKDATSGAVPVNSVTWRPYVNDLTTSAYLVLRGDGQVLGPWDSIAIPAKYTKTPRSLAGLQRVIGITDTAAAAKYQVVSAKLRNAAGEFVSPDAESLTAAAAAMTADPAQPQVYSLDSTSEAAKGAKGAYPLTLPVYAAVNPKMADAAVRADYADFINYAATSGQEPGTSLGMLPEGYAPLPAGWRDQALVAAATIAAGGPPPTTPAPSPSPTPSPRPAGTTSGTSSTVPVASPQVPAAAPQPASQPTDPVASGNAVTNLIGKATPADAKLGAITAAVPISIAAGLVAAVAVAMLSRIRRRL